MTAAVHCLVIRQHGLPYSDVSLYYFILMKVACSLVASQRGLKRPIRP